jgi:hypothetical protein
MSAQSLIELWRATRSGTLATLIGPHERVGARFLATASGVTAGDMFHATPIHVVAPVVEIISSVYEIPTTAGVLREPVFAAETEALLHAIARSIAGELMLIATILPREENALGRVVVEPSGNVSFASEWLPTEDVVDLRAAAKQFVGAHGPQTYRVKSVFLERLA